MTVEVRNDSTNGAVAIFVGIVAVILLALAIWYFSGSGMVTETRNTSTTINTTPAPSDTAPTSVPSGPNTMTPNTGTSSDTTNFGGAGTAPTGAGNPANTTSGQGE